MNSKELNEIAHQASVDMNSTFFDILLLKLEETAKSGYFGCCEYFPPHKNFDRYEVCKKLKQLGFEIKETDPRGEVLITWY